MIQRLSSQVTPKTVANCLKLLSSIMQNYSKLDLSIDELMLRQTEMTLLLIEQSLQRAVYMLQYSIRTSTQRHHHHLSGELDPVAPLRKIPNNFMTRCSSCQGPITSSSTTASYMGRPTF